METGKLVGAIGGLIFFLIILFIILYPNLDFDQKLINEVDSGILENELIAQIEEESLDEQLKSKKHLESHVMDMKRWDNHNISPRDDLKYEITLYNGQMEVISRLKETRIKYVKEEISKEEFLVKVRDYKFILHE